MTESVSFAPLAAEIFLLGMTCVVMLIDLYFPGPQRRNSFWAAQLALLGTLLITLQLAELPKAILYSGHYVHDMLAIVLKAGIYVVTAISLLYARAYISERQFMRGEYYMLSLLATLGMMVLVSAHSMLSVYLGLELMSLSLYAMVAMQRDSKQAPEAAMKYFVMGALASGFLLFGISILYGATGSIEVASLAQVPQSEEAVLMYRFALVFIIAGLAFKLGLVPFHMWIPDIYHGSPTSVTAFLGSAPKIAAFGMTIRILVEALPYLQADWQAMLAMLAVASMIIGNLGALAQSNLKRLLAYSAIAHMGYFMVGIIAGTNDGYSASLFYVLVYAVMTLGSFGMILFLSRNAFESDEISDVKGLAQRSPWYALLLAFIMLSMAGLPPFIGFWPKLQVFLAAVNAGYTWLALTGVVASVVGCYYYLKIVKVMFFDSNEDQTPIQATTALRVAISANGLAMLVLGLFPSGILAWCAKAFGV